ncbi:MAG: methyltransferase domain-containing protein [Chloroflexia bacterium]|nr:methyltransferase domain-containing protein [Chloroflexia bacterium]
MPDLFDLLARWYDRIFRFLDPAPLGRLLALEAGQRVLDLGGGTGRVAQHFDGAQIILCDYSAGMAREARDKGLIVCRGQAEALPFPDGCFDLLLVVDALHHFFDQQRAAAEMLRVLRPGVGRLVLEEPDIRRPVIRWIALLEFVLRMNSRFLRPGELRDLFERAGGQVVLLEEGDNASLRMVVAAPAGDGQAVYPSTPRR